MIQFRIFAVIRICVAVTCTRVTRSKYRLAGNMAPYTLEERVDENLPCKQ